MPLEPLTPSQVGYCTLRDVQNANPVRTIGTSTRPNIDNVNSYIEYARGVIDSILYGRGFSRIASVGALPTAVQVMLRDANAVGAAYKTEWAAPTSDKREEYEDMWQTAQKMIATAELQIPQDVKQTRPRGPKPSPTPFFRRDMTL